MYYHYYIEPLPIVQATICYDTTMKRLLIGIIGYGDFSKLMIEQLAPYGDIVVSSRNHSDGDAGFGARFSSLADVLACPIIIPSIPSQFFEDFFTENASLVNPHALVVDVCSVKVKPLEVLERLLPTTCQIIGTHPMFGPASLKKNNGITGLKCVISPTRVNDETLHSFSAFLSESLRLRLISKTPDQHDREMAYVQGLSHYIGRVMDIMDIPDTELATLAYEDLLDMKNIQGNDSWELFTSIMHENPYAKETNQNFKQAMRQLDQTLNSNKVD